MGPVRDVLGAYRAAVEGDAADRPQLEGLVSICDVSVAGPEGGVAATGAPLELQLTLESPDEHRAWIYLGVSEGAATPIFLVNPGREVMLKPGATRVRMEVPSLALPSGRYYIWGGIYKNWTQGDELFGWQPITHFDVHGPELDAAPKAVVRLSPLHIESNWEISRADAVVSS